MAATRGAAQAVLEAFGNGGWAVINHSKAAKGGPADTQIQIRPFDFFDGRHYCELDWHTIVIADIEGGDDRSFTHSDATAIIANLGVRFTLDGTPLQINETPVRAFLNPELFDLKVAFYKQWGRVMQPSDLAPGQHTLTVDMSDASGVQGFTSAITFFVDAAGSGVCT
jgi:hypothetical protein